MHERKRLLFAVEEFLSNSNFTACSWIEMDFSKKLTILRGL
jgi:hypothetical protein